MTRHEVRPGFSLNVDISGRGPAVILLHGFTGSTLGWDEYRRLLNERFTTYCVDMVGHGDSDKPEDVDRYRMPAAVDDVLRAVELAGARNAAWVGYSMGGRTALHVAAASPGRVRALVLFGASPGLATPAERAARVKSDEALADRIERDGVASFVDHWESIPLFATQRALSADVRARLRAGRLTNDAKGLANSLRGMGTGAQAPLFQSLATMDVPTVFLAGEHDAKFMAIGRDMAVIAPDATFSSIPDAGHAAQLENPTTAAAETISHLQRSFNEGAST